MKVLAFLLAPFREFLWEPATALLPFAIVLFAFALCGLLKKASYGAVFRLPCIVVGLYLSVVASYLAFTGFIDNWEGKSIYDPQAITAMLAVAMEVFFGVVFGQILLNFVDEAIELRVENALNEARPE